MQWRIVASTTIRAVRYDPASETLDIRFTNGHIYRYEDVPEVRLRRPHASEQQGPLLQSGDPG